MKPVGALLAEDSHRWAHAGHEEDLHVARRRAWRSVEEVRIWQTTTPDESNHGEGHEEKANQLHWSPNRSKTGWQGDHHWAALMTTFMDDYTWFGHVIHLEKIVCVFHGTLQNICGNCVFYLNYTCGKVWITHVCIHSLNHISQFQIRVTSVIRVRFAS